MAYDATKLTRLSHLKALAQKVAQETAALTHTYSVVKDSTAGEYAAVYHFTIDGVNTGAAINIPKDMVVQSGSVVSNPTGQPAGTYIKLVLQNVAQPLFINVGDLIEYVTSGSAATDAVVVAVDGTTHKVTASLTDGKITKAKLDPAVQATLTAADALIANNTNVEASETNGNIKVNGAEVTVYTLPADVVHGAIATDSEVTEMLNEVFGA